MSVIETRTTESRGKATPALAAGGLAAGVLASSCCLLPLFLVSVGISGAWISQLTALAPYQTLFLGVSAMALGAGFWRVYRRPDCATGSQCASPGVSRATRAILWIGAAAFLATIAVDVAAPLVLMKLS